MTNSDFIGIGRSYATAAATYGLIAVAGSALMVALGKPTLNVKKDAYSLVEVTTLLTSSACSAMVVMAPMFWIIEKVMDTPRK